MEYRRFGRTELQIPVLSCGGMRYQQGWSSLTPEEVEKENQDNLEATIHEAFSNGIYHIETARGYGSSEMQLGWVLPQLDRDKLIAQTKVGPESDVNDFRSNLEESFERLNLDYLDLFAFHGINTFDIFDKTFSKGGCLEVIREFQKDGRIRHIGFSSHGSKELLLKIIATDELDYMNFHYYYFDQMNAPILEAAAEKDMGVFIISPSDKGGMLYSPPDKLVSLCEPFTPMGFNDLWCLSHPDIHTISVGASKPSDFKEHLDIISHLQDAATVIAEPLARLDQTFLDTFDAEWVTNWKSGISTLVPLEGQVSVYHVLRLHNLCKAYDMHEFGKMRYNLFGNGGHWFAGAKVDQVADNSIREFIKESPIADRIIRVLHETHELLNADDKKRLSES
ncbi:aldo/keto reductase [bacterium AH-315-E10]|nr:aldo/keto reductase [bacterium AH-315-E10]